MSLKKYHQFVSESLIDNQEQIADKLDQQTASKTKPATPEENKNTAADALLQQSNAQIQQAIVDEITQIETQKKQIEAAMTATDAQMKNNAAAASVNKEQQAAIVSPEAIKNQATDKQKLVDMVKVFDQQLVDAKKRLADAQKLVAGK